MSLIGDLELSDEVRNEPLISSTVTEVEMTFTLDVDDGGLRLDLRDVAQRDTVLADLIASANEEGHGDLLNVGDVNQVGLVHTIEPVLRELLEAVNGPIRGPVLLILHREALRARAVSVVGANGAWEVSANRLQVSVPVGAVDGVDTVILERHDSLVHVGPGPVGVVHDEAGGHVHHLVEVVRVEGRLQVRQAVVHLNRALAVADVENFIDAGRLFNSLDVRDIIVEAHLRPREVPVLVVGGAVEGLMPPTVLGASVVADPDVVARIDQLKVERLLFIVVEPARAVLVIAVLGQDSALRLVRGEGFLADGRDNVERGQDVTIVRRHGQRLPLVAPFVHLLCEARVRAVPSLLEHLSDH